MQERTVTVGTQTRPLPSPFFVLATQNPIELEGTYPLPEAQLDRFFFKVLVPFPGEKDLLEIARRTTGESTPQLRAVADGDAILAAQRVAREVPIAEHVLLYAARSIGATHPDRTELDGVRRDVRWGASPRGLQTLVLAAKVRALPEGRYNAAFDDLSGSMDWGTPNKAETARRLAGAIAYVALAALDRVRLTIFADGPTSGGAP